MHFETINGIFTVTLDFAATTILAGILLLFGYYLKKKITVLDKLFFPAAVIGGLLFALLAFIFWATGLVHFALTTTLQAPLMILFFTCVGFGGNFGMLKTGGRILFACVICIWVIAIFQNVIGSGLAYLFHIHPILGLMTGSVSLVGGHGTAGAFGPIAEELGVTGASTVAIAAATYGLIAGALLGGPMAHNLIKNHHVPVQVEEEKVSRPKGKWYVVLKKSLFSGLNAFRKDSGLGSNPQDTEEEKIKEEAEHKSKNMEAIIKMVVLSGIVMVIGSFISDCIAGLHIKNLVLPNFVVCMFLAIIFRNINDKIEFVKIDFKTLGYLQDLGLNFFLAMAIMTLRIWELIDLALPLIVILVVQTIFVLVFIRFIAWHLLKKDYTSVVINAGLTSGTLGTTATALATMSAVCEKYEVFARKAFVLLPFCTSILLDMFNAPLIIIFLNLLQ